VQSVGIRVRLERKRPRLHRCGNRDGCAPVTWLTGAGKSTTNGMTRRYRSGLDTSNARCRGSSQQKASAILAEALILNNLWFDSLKLED